jgi:hypothetical protein
MFSNIILIILFTRTMKLSKLVLFLLCVVVSDEHSIIKSMNQLKYEALRLSYLKHLGYLHQYYLNRDIPINIKYHIIQTNSIIQQVKDLVAKDPSVLDLSDDKIVHEFFKNPFILVPRLKTLNQMRYDAWRKVRIYLAKLLDKLRMNGVNNEKIADYIILSSALSQINDIICDLETKDPRIIKYAEDLSTYDKNPMEDDDDPDLKTIDKFKIMRRGSYVRLTRF